MPQPSRSDAIVIIPTYNEADNIRILLQEISELSEPVDVLVVDDNSPDGTAATVKEMQEKASCRIELIERPDKLGLGSAYRTGFRYALGEGYTYICEMDADLSHDPADLPRLIEPVRNDKTDLAIGSRYVEGVRVINWPLTRLVLSYSAGIYTRAITQLPVKDVTAGFKCFHRKVLEDIDLIDVRSNGYSFQIEMKYRTWRRGFRLMEIPVIFTERTEGESKLSRGIVREAALKVWELSFRHLIGRL